MDWKMKAAVLSSILMSAGCDDAPTEQPDQSVAQVIVSVSATQIQEGNTITATAVARQADGTVRDDVAISWVLSDTAVAEITNQQVNSVTVRGKKAGSLTITAHAGQKSGAAQLSVTAKPVEQKPAPVLDALEPSASTEGSTGVVLHLKGSNFTAETFVQWNAVAKPTTYVSATELTVLVTPLDVASAGEAYVRVVTPGAGTTPALPFTIYGPPASIQLQEEPWPEVFLPGEQVQIRAVVRDRLGRELTGVSVDWNSATPATATVDASGVVRMIGAGQSRITARVATVVAEKYVNVAASPNADVIYDALEDGVRQLFITTPNMAGRRKLMQAIVRAEQPAPSPNGQRIAFVGTGTNGSTDIFVVNRDGSGVQQLTFTSYQEGQPAWSPDGQRIAFSSDRNSGYTDVWVMNADGSNAQNMTNDQVRVNMTGYEHPTWSPDGQYLVFTMSDFGMTPRRSVLIRLSLADRARTLLTNDVTISDAEPAYGHGSLLALRRTFPNSLGDQIQFINPLTGETWLYIDYPGQGKNPAISPNSAWVAFESTPRGFPSVPGVFLNWIGTPYRRTIGAGSAAGYPANPAWLPQ